MNVNADAKNGIQKILQQKLRDVPKGDDIAKDIQNSINKLLFNEPIQPNKDTKGDIERFFTDIQDGVRNIQTDTNQQKNLKKVKQDSPEQSKIALGESFLDEFDRMVEEVQDKYSQNKTIKPLIESYKKSIKKVKNSILKESNNKLTNKTRKELIIQTRYQTNTFFESVGLNPENKKYHDYLESVSDQQFKYLQNEGKRLIIKESTKILGPYFRKNKNKFKIKKLIREGFENNPESQIVPVEQQPVEYQENIPQWKDEAMMDDYDFQFMFLNYLDNNDSLVVSNNPELEQKLTDLQASLYENTNNLETDWENETGIQQDLNESELFDDKQEILNMTIGEFIKEYPEQEEDLNLYEVYEDYVIKQNENDEGNYNKDNFDYSNFLNIVIGEIGEDSLIPFSLEQDFINYAKKKQQIIKSSYNLNEQQDKDSFIKSLKNLLNQASEMFGMSLQQILDELKIDESQYLENKKTNESELYESNNHETTPKEKGSKYDQACRMLTVKYPSLKGWDKKRLEDLKDNFTSSDGISDYTFRDEETGNTYRVKL